jgi:hypothetical protein
MMGATFQNATIHNALSIRIREYLSRNLANLVDFEPVPGQANPIGGLTSRVRVRTHLV